MCFKKPKINVPDPAPAVADPMAIEKADMGVEDTNKTARKRGKRKLTIGQNSVGTGVNL